MYIQIHNENMYSDMQRRELFHFVFLERFLKATDAGLYSLKGGVNLRFFLKSPRYSEDMDLDVFGGGVETLKKNGYKILEDVSFHKYLAAYRSPSSISRELSKGYSRNSFINYSVSNAQIISQKNESSRNSGKIKLQKHPNLRKFIKSKLELKWSPEQIEMSLKENLPSGITESVSHQTIYTYIYLLPRGELKKELQSYLRRKMKPWNNRHGNRR
jgi:hypothetical protein